MHVYLSPFKAFTKKIVKEIIRYKSSNIYIDALILKATKNISVVPVTHNKRLYGASNFTLVKSILIFIRYFSAIIQLSMPNTLGKIFNKINRKPQNIISETISKRK